MELKIEMQTTEMLTEFRKFLFEKDKDIIVYEQYDHEPGFNKEPVVTGIIIALGGKKLLVSLQKIIKDFFDYKNEKQRINLEQRKVELQAELIEKKMIADYETMKFQLKHKEKTKDIGTTDFFDIEYEEL